MKVDRLASVIQLIQPTIKLREQWINTRERLLSTRVCICAASGDLIYGTAHSDNRIDLTESAFVMVERMITSLDKQIIDMFTQTMEQDNDSIDRSSNSETDSEIQ